MVVVFLGQCKCARPVLLFCCRVTVKRADISGISAARLAQCYEENRAIGEIYVSSGAAVGNQPSA
jgi:hypothetical protein